MFMIRAKLRRALAYVIIVTVVSCGLQIKMSMYITHLPLCDRCIFTQDLSNANPQKAGKAPIEEALLAGSTPPEDINKAQS